jgi:hypothetical protein
MRPSVVRPPDPLDQAEAALRKLREARDPESRRRAADELLRALKGLHEEEQDEGVANGLPEGGGRPPSPPKK